MNFPETSRPRVHSSKSPGASKHNQPTKCEKMEQETRDLFETHWKNLKKTRSRVFLFCLIFSLFCSSTWINCTHDRNATAQISLLQGKAKLQILWISYDLLFYKSKRTAQHKLYNTTISICTTLKTPCVCEGQRPSHFS